MRKHWAMMAVTAVVLVLGTSTIAGAKSQSGTGRQIVSRTTTLQPPEGSDVLNVDELVTCPAGSASVSGGWAWITPPSGADTARRVTGGPDATNWRVVFTILTDPDPHTAEFWAICVNA